MRGTRAILDVLARVVSAAVVRIGLVGFVVVGVSMMADARAQGLEGVLMPGKVIQGHAKYEDDCRSCHVPFDKAAQDRLCLDCHKAVAADVRGKRGFHGRLKPEPCRNCHTDHKGREARIVLLDRERFDHAQTDYALRAAHQRVRCEACHRPGAKWREAPLECLACHRKDDRHKGNLGAACADCHSERTWREARFDHDTTRFGLAGAHVKVECKACHANEVYKGVAQTCVGCHRKDDRHKSRLGEKCDRCHGVADWKTISFDHDRDTDFALRGRHRPARCESCHASPGRPRLQTSCLACHEKDDKHAGTLGRDCGACHTERKWTETRIDHDRTRFPLRGRHVDAPCADCHRDLATYRETPRECATCHRKDDRHAGTLGSDCAACHGERDWKVPRYDHSRTRFPLTGRHAAAPCKDCHADPKSYKGISLQCVACHRKDDDHKGRFGDRCEACHGDVTWKPARFDHARDTRYALRGRHATVKCVECHAGHLYRDKVGTACVACHAKDDRHRGQLGERCESCHSETDWRRTTFDHARTRFPLLGRHLRVECGDCHVSLAYKDVRLDCASCHAKDDVHKRTLGSKCESCHNARDWRAWDFDHDRRTEFRLDGGHKGVACSACHKAPLSTAAKVPTACASCHAHDDVHNGAFGSRCERCHVTSSFRVIRPGTRGTLQ